MTERECRPNYTLSPSEVLVFFRADGFYPIQAVNELSLTKQAEMHAELNPGTIRIEDREGNVLWRIH